MKKEEREKRKAFINNLAKKNVPISEILKRYDKAFGTHYYERTHPHGEFK